MSINEVKVGMRVESHVDGDDAGRVISIDAATGMVVVAWDQGVTTPAAVEDLDAE